MFQALTIHFRKVVKNSDINLQLQSLFRGSASVTMLKRFTIAPLRIVNLCTCCFSKRGVLNFLKSNSRTQSRIINEFMNLKIEFFCLLCLPFFLFAFYCSEAADKWSGAASHQSSWPCFRLILLSLSSEKLYPHSTPINFNNKFELRQFNRSREEEELGQARESERSFHLAAFVCQTSTLCRTRMENRNCQNGQKNVCNLMNGAQRKKKRFRLQFAQPERYFASSTTLIPDSVDFRFFSSVTTDCTQLWVTLRARKINRSSRSRSIDRFDWREKVN